MKKIEYIKEDYLKPCPILYKYKGCIETSLVSRDMNTAVGITLKQAVNECDTLTFNIPFNADRKIDWNSLEKLVYFNDTFFIIKEIEVDDSTMDMKISSEEMSSALKGIYCECVCEIGKSPQEIFNAIVTASKMDIGYKWLGTDIDASIKRHVITESETSTYENLMSLAKIFNATIEFTYDSTGQGYVYLRKNAINTGKFIKKNIDMKSLNVTTHSKEVFSKIYPTGKTDDYGITLDIQDVNNGNSILTDYSYFQSMGIPDNIIIKEPQYNQLISVSDDTYIASNDLKQWAREQLDIYCKPQWSANLKMSDLAIFVDSPIEVPKKMMALKCINKDISFIFDCQITSVERNFDNPADISIEISNVIPYDTNTQRTGHAIDAIDDVTTIDPRDTDGDVVGDGSRTIIAEKVCDLDHINVVYRIGETKTLITETGEKIELRVENIKGDYATLLVTINGITSTVVKQGVAMSEINQKCDSITLTVKDLTDITNQTYSQIIQTAEKISAIVVKGSNSASWELSSTAAVTAIKNATGDHTCTFDTSGLTIQNGGFYVKNSSGTQMLYFEDEGYGVIPNFFTDDITVHDPNNAPGLKGTFAKMNVWFPTIGTSKLDVTGEVHIGGKDMYSYVESVLRDYSLI